MSEKFKPQWEDKCWGRVQHIFVEPAAAVSKLQVNSGWMCSRHSHKHRYNMFSIDNGAVVVEEWDNEMGLATTIVGAGEVLVVPPGIVHRFRVLRRGSLVEVYWTEDGTDVDANDINRLDIGGKDETLEQELKEAGLI